MNDAEFLCALETCTLPEADFGHAAHVRACYLYLKSGDFVSALARLRDAIRRYAGSLGKSERYHETITVAYAALIQEKMAERDDGDWPTFAKNNPELFTPDLLQRIYPASQLESELARRIFVLPRGATVDTAALETSIRKLASFKNEDDVADSHAASQRTSQ